MGKSKLTDTQWGDVRTAWISTDREVRDIAREFGVSDTAVNKRAAKEGWGPRNAPARKRAIVDRATAGLREGLATKPNQSPGEAAIAEAAQVDIEDMDLAISVGRRLLRRCSAILASCEEMTASGDPDLLVLSLKIMPPKDLASVAGTWKMAVEGIRKIRGLDEPQPPPDMGARRIILVQPDGAETDLG